MNLIRFESVLCSMDDAMSKIFPSIRFALPKSSAHAKFMAIARILFANRASAEAPITFCLHPSVDLSRSQDPYIALEFPLCVPPVPSGDWVDIPAAGALKRVNVVVNAFRSKTGIAGRIYANLDRVDWVYLATLIPQLVPDYFRAMPLTETEKELLTAIVKDDEQTVSRIVAQYETQFQITKKLDEMIFSRFFDGMLDRKLSVLKNQESTLLTHIRATEEQLTRYWADYNAVTTNIFAIQCGHKDDALEEFKVAFLNNPNCTLVDTSGNNIVFRVSGFVDNFNETSYESMSRELGSVLYEDVQFPARQAKRLYDELFLGNRYKVNCYGVIQIDFDRNVVTLCQGCGGGPNEIPNPHIEYYRCMGGFNQLYNEAMMRGDYLEVLDIAFSEVRNINWTDISPVRRFRRDLWGGYYHHPCIWDKHDGVFITPCELRERVASNEQ